MLFLLLEKKTRGKINENKDHRREAPFQDSFYSSTPYNQTQRALRSAETWYSEKPLILFDILCDMESNAQKKWKKSRYPRMSIKQISFYWSKKKNWCPNFIILDRWWSSEIKAWEAFSFLRLSLKEPKIFLVTRTLSRSPQNKKNRFMVKKWVSWAFEDLYAWIE